MEKKGKIMLDKKFLEKKYEEKEYCQIFETREQLLKLAGNEKLLAEADELANLVVGLKLDASSVCAALIFAVKNILIQANSEFKFGKPLTDNADVLSLLKKLEKCNSLAKNYTDADGLKEMLIAITKDIRVIIIKIADVLVYARHNKDFHNVKSEEVFKSIDDIFVPIAARLGLSEIKSELQDLSFYFHKKEEYLKLLEDVQNETRANNLMIESVVEKLKTMLADSGIKCTCYGRVKHLSSIYNKLNQKKLTLKNIYDISAVRILVDSVAECYTALGLVHSSLTPVDGRFKDYIASPKPNGYQSLHTTVYFNHEFFEIQIRTYAMHEFAEYGVAAHFLYKEHKNSIANIDSKLIWIRKMLENKDEVSGSELLKELKTDVYLGEIFVCSPKGKVVKMPENSTPIDFAYMIHSEVGNKCVGAKVNGSMVPLFSTLQNGDVVEILTSQSSKGPSRDWIKKVRTQQAKDKIGSFFKKQMKEENIKLGKAMIENYAKSNDIQLASIMKDEYINEILKKSAFLGIDDIYASIGYGSIKAEGIVTKLLNLKLSDDKKSQMMSGNVRKLPLNIENKADIIGTEGTLTKYCKLCCPIPGDKIVGYVSRGRGIIIHKTDCESLEKLNESRLINVDWNINKEKGFEFNSSLDLVVRNTPTIYMDITNSVGEMGVKVTSLNTSTNRLGDLVIKLGVMVKGREELTKLKNKLSSLNAVYEVK